MPRLAASHSSTRQGPIPRPLLCTAALEKDDSGVYNRLYGHNRDGTFTDLTERASLSNRMYWPQNQPAPLNKRSPAHRTIAVALVVILSAGAVVALLPLGPAGLASARTAQAASARNNGASNEYVGSQACAECHRAIYSAFSKNTMGRQISHVSPVMSDKF